MRGNVHVKNVRKCLECASVSVRSEKQQWNLCPESGAAIFAVVGRAQPALSEAEWFIG